MEASTAKEGQGGEPDLSMEEILQSIRKIIADDDTGEKKTVAEETAKPQENGAAKEPEAVVGSDVLELTDAMLVKDDAAAVKSEAPSGDVLGAIDQALTPAKPAEKLAEQPIEKPAEKPAEAPVEKPMQPPAAAPQPAPVNVPPAPADSLLSSEAATTAASAFKHLQNTADPVPAVPNAIPSPPFTSGNTVENMVKEMLYPLMKSWLDANLPAIVERIVEREVKKLTRH